MHHIATIVLQTELGPIPYPVTLEAYARFELATGCTVGALVDRPDLPDLIPKLIHSIALDHCPEITLESIEALWAKREDRESAAQRFRSLVRPHFSPANN